MFGTGSTSVLQMHLDRLAGDDLAARDELVTHACERLRVLTRNLSRGDRVRRFADTDDVLDGAVIALRYSLLQARPASVAEFLRLAAFHIRRELTRLAREYYGPTGWARRHVLCPAGESSLFGATAYWADRDPSPSHAVFHHEDIARLHSAVDALCDELRDVVDLLWLHGMKQREAANILGVATKTVQRRWIRARLRLHRSLADGEDSR